ncbi:MAG TPA: hypothetical protein VF151_10945 [Gemmatimonadales bacterium]
MFEVTTEDMVACVERELKMRRQVYPRWVEQKKLTERTANEELRRMEAVGEAVATAGAARELLESMAATKLRDWNMQADQVTLHFVDRASVDRFRAAFDQAVRAIRGVVPMVFVGDGEARQQ